MRQANFSEGLSIRLFLPDVREYWPENPGVQTTALCAPSDADDS